MCVLTAHILFKRKETLCSAATLNALWGFDVNANPSAPTCSQQQYQYADVIRCNDFNGQHQVLDLIYIQIYKTQLLTFSIDQCGPVFLSSICLLLLSSTAKANALDEIVIWQIKGVISRGPEVSAQWSGTVWGSRCRLTRQREVCVSAFGRVL